MAATQKPARNFVQLVVAKLKRCLAQAPLIAALTVIHAYAYGQVQPGTPVSMSENGNSLPEPIHDKVRAAALLPNRTEAARAAVKELQLSGFFDGLPRMNERDYYRCSREGQGWMLQATSNAINVAVMTQNRERYQKEFDGWWTAMERNCEPQFWNAAKSRLLQLTVSLKGINSARAAIVAQVQAEELAKKNQEEEQKIADATERNKRQQADQEQVEATRAAERDKAAAANIADSDRLREQYPHIKSKNDVLVLLKPLDIAIAQMKGISMCRNSAFNYDKLLVSYITSIERIGADEISAERKLDRLRQAARSIERISLSATGVKDSCIKADNQLRTAERRALGLQK